MEMVLLWCVFGMQIVLAAYLTWLLAKVSSVLFEIEARVHYQTLILSSINNVMVMDMLGDDDEDLVEAPIRPH